MSDEETKENKESTEPESLKVEQLSIADTKSGGGGGGGGDEKSLQETEKQKSKVNKIILK